MFIFICLLWRNPRSKILPIVLPAALLLCFDCPLVAQPSTNPIFYNYPSVGFAYTQNFSTLPQISTYQSSLIGKGPYFLGSLHSGLTGLFIAQNSGSSLVLNFATSAGSNATPGIFSYGPTNSAIRGLGSLSSSAGAYIFGVAFTNKSSSVIDQFEIDITAGQWRKGGSGKANQWTFSYITTISKSVLDTGFTTNPLLDFSSVQTSAGAAAVNGILAVNQQRKKDTITHLNWKPNEQLILKWEDKDEVGNDDGMAIQLLQCKALSMPDNKAPTAVELLVHNVKTYTTGDTLVASILFSKPCFLSVNTFAPYLVATISDSAKNIVYAAGSGSNLWYFYYVIEQGDLVKNGLQLFPKINASIGSIQDASANICEGLITGNTRFASVQIDAAPPQFLDSTTAHVHSCKSFISMDVRVFGVTKIDSTEAIIWKLSTPPMHGKISGLPFSSKTLSDTSFPGPIIYTPTQNYLATDSLYIEVTDGVNSVRKKITITADAPITNNSIGENQIVCTGFTPQLLIGTNLPNTSYYWLYKEDTAKNYKVAPGSNVQRNYLPNTLQSTTSFKRIANRFTCTDTSSSLTIIVKKEGIWVGANEGIWQIGSNWCGGLVPDSSTHVLIQNGQQIIISHLLNAQQTTCQSLTIEAGASLIIKGIFYLPTLLNVSGFIDGTHGSIYITADSSTIITSGTFKNKTIKTLQIDTKKTVRFVDSLFIDSCLTLFNGRLEIKHLTILNGAQIARSGNQTQIIGPATFYKKIDISSGQTKLLSLPFISNVGLKDLKKNIKITGPHGTINGFDSARHQLASVAYLDANTNNYKALEYIGYSNLDSSIWQQNSGIKIWLYPNNPSDTSVISEIPFVETKRHSSFVLFSATGFLQHGPLEINFPATSTTNYYLTGNPYPSGIDASRITSSSSIGKYYWFWDTSLGETGNYQAAAFRFPTFVASLQGFIVKNTVAKDGTLYFEERTKINNDEAIDTTTYKKEYAHISMILTKENNLLDRLEIIGIDSASSKYEKWDAEKINNATNYLYSISRDSVELSIDARPFNKNIFIPIGIKTNSKGKFRFVCTELVYGNDLVTYWHDRLLNKYQKIIKDSSYLFEITADSTSGGEHRFEITGPPPPPLQEDPIIAILLPNPAYTTLNIQYSFRENLPYQISIHSMLGATLISQSFAASKSGSAKLNVHTLLAGNYFVSIKAGKNYLLKQFIKL